MANHGLEQVGKALAAVHSADDRVAAEAFLTYAETNIFGYYPMLQHISQSSEYDKNTRILASIGFKNGMDKYWRKSAKNAISEDQKSQIRKNLISAVSNGDSSVLIARQQSIAIAKIARIDFPNEWPNLFEELLRNLSNCQNDSNSLLTHLYTLHQVVKTLCSIRISRARENFQHIAPKLLQFVAAVYSSYADRWLSNQDSQDINQDLHISDQALKITRRLVCYGFETPYDDEQCRLFFSLLSSHVPRMWSIFTELATIQPSDDTKLEAISKNLLHAGKFFLELSSNSMQNYVMNYNYVLMPGSMSLVRGYWSIVTQAAYSGHRDIRKVVLQGLILLKQCIKLVSMPETHLNIMKNKENEQVSQALQILRGELFAESSLISILENIITLFFVLREEDVNEWDANSEDWMIDQEESHWQFSTRPCAERVFLDLFAQFKTELIRPLLSVLEARATPQNSQDLLMKEALYNALGIAAPHLYDIFDFDSFLTVLQKEVHDPNLASIFKRRILILVSQWVSVKCGDDHRPIVYDIFRSQIQSTDGSGLSLAAAFVMPKVIDDWDWKVETFEPFAADIVRSLVHCLGMAEETESKMRLLTTIGSIFERMEAKVGDELNMVLQQVPTEWHSCGDQHLLKVALLGLLSRMILSQKHRAAEFYPFALPLIQYSTNPSNFEHVYLIEEALEMWHAILQNAFEPSEDLLLLFPVLLQPELLPNATDTLKKILFILESYLLLMPDRIREKDLDQLLIQDIVMIIPGLQTAALSHCTRVLSLATKVWGADSFTNDQIWRLSELLLSSRDDPVVDVCYLCLISEMTLSNPNRVVHVWTEHPQGDLTQAIIQKLVERFDNIGHARYRKLCAMGITAMTQTRHPVFRNEQVLAYLGNIWGDTLAEVQANCGNDLIYWADDSALLEDLEVDTAEITRRKALSGSSRDQVSTTHLKNYIRGHTELVDINLLGVDLRPLLE